jgi:hypothetical protein
MLSLLYLASALILGASVTKRLRIKLLMFEWPALAISIGLVLWSWLSLLTALMLPYSYSLQLTVVLSGAISFWLLQMPGSSNTFKMPGGHRAFVLWAAFTIAVSGLLGFLMFTHDLLPNQGNLYSANSTWADLGLHASIISHFTANTHLILDLPVAAGAHLTYPFIIDLLSSWLVLGGWSLQWALLIPSLLLSLAFFQLMIGIGVRIFNSIGGMITGLILMLFSGSAVGIEIAFNDLHTSNLTISQFLTHLPKDYTALSTPNAQITNFLADALLPQRTFTMGLAVFGTVILLLTELRRDSKRDLLALFTGTLIGLLPLIHAQTFIILMVIVIVFWLDEIIRKHSLRNTWLLVASAAILVAFPQLTWQFFATPGGTGGHLSLGWVILPGESVLSFWANNYGISGILIIFVTAILIIRRKLRQYLIWYVPFFIIFGIANIYAFQPFAYDNVKLIYYVYLVTYIAAGYLSLNFIKRWPLSVVPFILVAILLCSSGTLSILREFQHQDIFASTDDLSLAQWAKRNTNSADVFLTTDKPNQPIATLAGRSIVLGYRGWLYNYHLNYQPRVDAVQAALLGKLTGSNEYHANYVVIATFEPTDWTIDQPAISTNYNMVYSNTSWRVYQLSKP